jgi:hypothetical protein
MISAPPPLPQTFSKSYRQAQSAAQPLAASSSTCACGKVFNLSVERGATLTSKITLSLTDQNTGVKSPVDVTGATFQFTAKPHQSDGSQLPDSDPSVILIDWAETVSPAEGVTWLTVPAATTESMLSTAYDQQCRMVSSSGVVTPLFSGSLVVTEPVSPRF